MTPHIGSFYLEELHALRIAQPLAALLPYGCGTYPLRVIRCGVRGFATSLCESVHSATAPYYREARVTVDRRQTACGRGIAALAALFSLLLELV